MKNLKKGFTLIELLVVVAIIGIIASVVLVSLGDAKNKGGDATVKSNLVNIRGQAEILYTTHGNYAVDSSPTYFALAQCTNTSDTMFSDNNIWEQIYAANSAGPKDLTQTRCYSASNAWAIAVKLKSSDGATSGSSNTLPDSWCVDSGGAGKSYAWASGETIADAINATFCR